ncbi:OmpA family protein [Vibrio sp. SCSIO 43136]|uniref:OmpA/MotB family protein n=1 Tax=Vibrio sp. SCSIO 43136 TaxID=2819101 RepID=UPI0020756B5F|nr:OmpA family protein [Vibrio sp. SCSIO 43136]USD67923.1 OmpA family protein [Vibrio sp. SCSIO 43136]
MARQRVNQELKEDNEWMTTYSDAITLLLAFFVLIVAVSQIDEGKLEDLKKGRTSIMGEPADVPMEVIQAEIQEIVEEQKLESVVITPVIDGLKIELDSENLYQSGSADLTSKGEQVIREFAGALLEVNLEDRAIVVEGHSDDVPINTSKYRSNWELSGSRAVQVVQQLIDLGINKNLLSAIAYADTRPRADQSLTIEKQREQNRRVVIYIKRDYTDR